MDKSTDISVIVESLSYIYHRLRKEVNGQLVNKVLSMSEMKIPHLIATEKSVSPISKLYGLIIPYGDHRTCNALEEEMMQCQQRHHTDRRVKYVYITGKVVRNCVSPNRSIGLFWERMFAPFSEMQLEKFSEVCNVLAA